MLVSIFSALTLVADACIVLLLILRFAPRGSWRSAAEWVRAHRMTLAFTVAALATAGSLLFSELAGFLPCKLCWFQRILMYPQALIFGVALWKRENVFAPVLGLLFSVLGGIIAAYHYYLQWGGTALVPCAADPTQSCAQRLVFQYGYVTIPMMALSAFVLIVLLLLPPRGQNAPEGPTS